MVNNKLDIIRLLQSNKQSLAEFGVEGIGLFGSFVKGQQHSKSDIDFLVEFSSGKKSYRNFIHLVYYLENLLGREVEVVTPKSISPYLKPHIDKTIEYVSLA